MVTVYLMNLKTKVEFIRRFDSPYKANVFINKCRFSKEVRVIGKSYDGSVYAEK